MSTEWCSYCGECPSCGGGAVAISMEREDALATLEEAKKYIRGLAYIGYNGSPNTGERREAMDQIQREAFSKFKEIFKENP